MKDFKDLPHKFQIKYVDLLLQKIENKDYVQSDPPYSFYFENELNQKLQY